MCREGGVGSISLENMCFHDFDKKIPQSVRISPPGNARPSKNYKRQDKCPTGSDDHAGRDGFVRAGIDEDEGTSEAVAAVGVVEQWRGGSERDAADVVHSESACAFIRVTITNAYESGFGAVGSWLGCGEAGEVEASAGR